MNYIQTTLTDAEIDELVIADVDEEAAWEEPIQVAKTVSSALHLAPALAERATFLAKLHHERSLEAWLTRIIEERIELEEGAYLQAKRELGQSAGVTTVM